MKQKEMFQKKYKVLKILFYLRIIQEIKLIDSALQECNRVQRRPTDIRR